MANFILPIFTTFALIVPICAGFAFGPFHLPGDGHFARHHQWPPFLRNVSASARRQFFQLATNSNGTKAEVLDQLEAWATTNGVQEAFNNCSQKARQLYANVSQWFAGDALKLYNALGAIRQNMSITRLAECQQMRQLLEDAQPMLRHLVPLPLSTIPGPPPRACFALYMGFAKVAAGQRPLASRNQTHIWSSTRKPHNVNVTALSGTNDDGDGDPDRDRDESE